MKKTLRYIVLFWAMIAASSCVQPLDEADRVPFRGDYGITLSVACSEPATKAAKHGEDRYNENKVDYVDWFIFKSADDTGDALMHGRAAVSQDMVSYGLNTAITVVRNLAMDELVTDSQRSFYIYTVANAYTVVDNQLQPYAHDDLPLTLTGLKAITLAAAFNKNPFSEQDYFVMRGGVSVTFEDGDRGSLKPVTAELSRVAAKISVNMNVAPAIDQMKTLPNGSKEYVKTWYPVFKDSQGNSLVQVYLSFANQETTLDGTPVSYNQNSFFTYNRYAFKPAYSYPDASGGPSETVPSVTPDWDDNTWKWNVTGTPFYSYPMEWESASPQAPFIKVILTWASYDEEPPVNTRPYYELVKENEDGTVTVIEEGQTVPEGAVWRFKRAMRGRNDWEQNKEFYYKIPLPDNVLNSNDWYDLTFDVAILGGTSDELPVELAGQFYVTDWNESGIRSGGHLKEGHYLYISKDTYYIYGRDDISIPFHSSHEISSIEVLSAEAFDYSTGELVPATIDPYSTTNPYGYRTSLNGLTSFTFSRKLHTDVSQSNVNCYVAEFVVKLTNEAGDERTVTIIQEPPIYISGEQSNGYVFINGRTNRFEYTSNYNYKTIFDDGDNQVVDTYSPTLNNNNNTYNLGNNTSSRVRIAFSNVENETSGGTFLGKRMGTNNRDGTIKITAPGGYTITQVTIGYYTGRGNQEVTWSPEEAGSSKTQWAGAASCYNADNQENNNYGVTITMPRGNNQNSRNVVSSISVTYAHSSNQAQMGHIMAYNYRHSTVNNFNIYTVSISNMTIYEQYYVGDPRRETPIDIPTLRQGGRGDGKPLTGFRPVTADIHYAISPRFKVASAYGASLDGDQNDRRMTFQSARKRCASYQESGYPAGRWRIPTDAEIKLIAQLSASEKLPNLFNGRYWSSRGASGTALYVDADTGTVSEEANQTYASVRCVYDAWYWGDEPMTDYLKTWSGWHTQL